MTRVLLLLFSFVAYCVFFATFLYLVAFVSGLSRVPYSVDGGGIVENLWIAIPIDCILVALFGLQHSVMARPAFKRWWTKIVPEPIERSIYVLSASLMLILLFLFWRPIPRVIWTITNDVTATVLWSIFVIGWLIVLLSTFMISHFELFGLSQVWGHVRGKPAMEPVFRTPFFYKLVRHPLYSGFILAFFATPHMTVGHALLATTMFGYILVAIHHEERDLVTMFGDRYVDYRAQVGMLSPRLKKSARKTLRR